MELKTLYLYLLFKNYDPKNIEKQKSPSHFVQKIFIGLKNLLSQIQCLHCQLFVWTTW